MTYPGTLTLSRAHLAHLSALLQILGVEFGGPQDNTRRPNKNVAYVKVRYRVGEQLVEGSIQVWRDRTGPVRPWSLGDGATGPLFIINALVPRARVAGASVATVKAKPANGMDGAVWVPPGVFTISGTGDHPLFTSKPVSVAVPPVQSTTPSRSWSSWSSIRSPRPLLRPRLRSANASMNARS